MVIVVIFLEYIRGWISGLNIMNVGFFSSQKEEQMTYINVAVFDNLLVNKNYKCRHLQTGAGTSNSNVFHGELMVLRVGTNDPYSLSLFSYELSFERAIANWACSYLSFATSFIFFKTSYNALFT